MKIDLSTAQPFRFKYTHGKAKCPLCGQHTVLLRRRVFVKSPTDIVSGASFGYCVSCKAYGHPQAFGDTSKWPKIETLKQAWRGWNETFQKHGAGAALVSRLGSEARHMDWKKRFCLDAVAGVASVGEVAAVMRNTQKSFRKPLALKKDHDKLLVFLAERYPGYVVGYYVLSPSGEHLLSSHLQPLPVFVYLQMHCIERHIEETVLSVSVTTAAHREVLGIRSITSYKVSQRDLLDKTQTIHQSRHP